METSLKTDFAQIFSRCPKNLSCPKFGGAAAPLAPPARTHTFYHSITGIKCFIFQENFTFSSKQSLTQSDSD